MRLAEVRLPGDHVVVEQRGAVAVVRLNRPDRANAVDVDTAHALGAVAQACELDTSVGAVVLTGTGRAFCAGGDIAAIRRGQGPHLSFGPGGFAGFVQLRRSTPWIAALNGSALGGGLEIALACDVRLTVADAVFGLPEATLGMVAAAGGVLRLARSLPSSRAVEILLAGQRFDAAEAERWGLVSRVVDPQTLLDDALSLAEAIARTPRPAVEATLQLLRASWSDGAFWEQATHVLARMSDGETVHATLAQRETAAPAGDT